MDDQPTRTSHTYRLTTPNTPLSPKICRDTVAMLLTANGHRPDLTDTARTLVSEIVTNAVTHTGSPTIDLETEVLCDGVRVVGYDDHAVAEPLAALDVSRDSEYGRGLLLVQALADDWGAGPAARPHGRGKNVWFELRRDGGGTGFYRTPTILDT
ncbi:ATP-binding protein [Streptomyces venezuelae]|uniref:ATP-binding protein n=1 Tax=Streptomyces venezuelae TaxID=54571 RepID=UPI00345613ED